MEQKRFARTWHQVGIEKERSNIRGSREQVKHFLFRNVIHKKYVFLTKFLQERMGLDEVEGLGGGRPTSNPQDTGPFLSFFEKEGLREFPSWFSGNESNWQA